MSEIENSQISEEELKKLIKERWFPRWSIRADRVLRYFRHNPEEIKYFHLYRIGNTKDMYFLERHPYGYKNWYRIGENIGADAYGLGNYFSVYLYREVKENE